MSKPKLFYLLVKDVMVAPVQAATTLSDSLTLPFAGVAAAGGGTPSSSGIGGAIVVIISLCVGGLFPPRLLKDRRK
jgi:hypothetical protein